MYIHQGISLSVDCFTNSICLLFIAYVLSLKNQKELISKKQYTFLLMIMCAISITKYVYTPIVLLSLLLLNKEKNNEKLNFRILIYIIISFLIAASLFIATNRALVSGNQSIEVSNLESSYANSAIDVIKKPMDYVNILYNTILGYGCEYFETLFGSKLGWMNININRVIIYFYVFILLVSIYLDETKMSKSDKILSIIISLVTANLIFLAFYLSYVNTSQDFIFGVQGRYFIPIVPLLFYPMINNKKNKINMRQSLQLLFCGVILIYVFFAMDIINSFI